MKNQTGVSLMGLLMICVVLVIVAIGGLKVTPAYLEYLSVKKAVAALCGSEEIRLYLL